MKFPNKVIVLILSYNGKHLLEDSVSSYLANDYPNFEVVVVDNGSTDGTKEWVNSHFPNVYVHRTDKNLKYSGGLNFGMNYAFGEKKADYVLITNNDVKADVNLISELVKTADADEKIGFTIGKVYYYDKPKVLQTVGKKYDPVLWNGGHIGNMEEDKGQYDEICERYWCDDIYWLVRMEVWEKTGGYDTEFAFQGEDFDWQVRAKQLGYKIYYTPHAKLWHKESMTIGKVSAFKMYYESRNNFIIHAKYRRPEEFKKYFRSRINDLIRASFKSFLKFRWSITFAINKGVLSFFLWGCKNNKLTLRHFI